jgi:hypothetical protein
MNLAYLINAAATQSFSAIDSSICRTQSQALISCLKTKAGFSQFESENCILCTVSASEDSTGQQSTATLCDEFESDGFCSNLNQCFNEDCSNQCREEYKTWATCVFDDIGCPFLCRRKKGVMKIA